MPKDERVAERWPFTHLRRSIEEPIREGLRWEERWHGPDQGLIACWERGRKKRGEESDLAARVEKGELVPLSYRGGVTKKLKLEKTLGTLSYLATWQGLRGEDLDIAPYEARVIVCSKTGQAVSFSGAASFSSET
jgi:hypothetical protein